MVEARLLIGQLGLLIPALQLQTFDQLGAALPHLQPVLAFAVLQPRLHVVHAITDRRVGLRRLVADVIRLQDLNVSAGCVSAAVVAAGVW